MATFLEVSKSLDTALTDAKAKKLALENADTALKKAGEEYQESVYKAQQFRAAMNAILTEALPADELKPKIG